jgi:outer membrane protein OmpA-like peptidoglycan-associated protein
MRFKALIVVISLIISGCSGATSGPDKTIGGAVLGAGWGAGAGAVVGNQVSTSGVGAGVGAGLGAAQGMMIGAGMDLAEVEQIDRREELAALRAQNSANARGLKDLQSQFDRATVTSGPGAHTVFFDSDATNLRAGSVANLEVFAEHLRTDVGARVIVIAGHTDDSGDPIHNERLAMARARSVSAYLATRGLSSDQMVVRSYGAQRPVASNATPEGRQLNRRVEIYAQAR